ncbi:hypothetical protein PFMALIP_02436 [Plasmodium falciparum MaliPS096_E11]|uniref:Uncharacterized protein n=2 Tax=Plasmodium falciparum TaxID=5833 RepID=W7K6U0_PLAFO|nr:hypothetical protein PFMALIP_02436 [Plasmodium falciparum MaliPS096_E11]EWC88725.1 hypothetical protein PFNF54_02569 [Plasmodium falciparum NF54]
MNTLNLPLLQQPFGYKVKNRNKEKINEIEMYDHENT